MALSLIVLCCQDLCAQDMVMGIDGLFRLADENSVSIQTFSTGIDAAEEALKGAKSQRLPDISASLSVNFLGDGRIWDRDFGNGMKVDIPSFGNDFAIEASQVIYAGGAVDSGVEMARLGKRMAELDWQKNRRDIHFLLLGWYLDLYKMRNQIRVLDRNLELADRVIGNMKARREEGTVLENDITRYELQKETLMLQRTRLQDGCRILNRQLTVTLHLPDSVTVVPDSTILLREVLPLAEQDWQQRAGQSSIDLQRSARLPRIAVVAADHLDGPVTIEVPALDNNFNYWYVGLGIRYDLSSLFKSGKKIRQARLNVRRARESFQLAREQVENAVQAGYVNFMTSFTDLKTQEKTVELADQNYEVISYRYENGLALLTDMLDASNMKLSAGLALLNLSYTVITATCDGMTGHKDIHEGQLVQPGQTMVEIVDGTGLWVIANYRETQLRHIREGAGVSVTADAVPGVRYEGVVEAISDATGAAFSMIPQDNATGNFVKVEQRVPVRISLSGNDPGDLKLLRAGLNVECKVRY